MKKVLLVIGTRPELIKMAPIYFLLEKRPNWDPSLCFTGQHTTLLDPFLASFRIPTESSGQHPPLSGDLYEQAASIVQFVGEVLSERKPDLLLTQGDTTTAFAASLASFYAKVPVGHVEAGLRTNTTSSPWPEEGHRRMITPLASYFFAPCERAKENLLKEGVSEKNVWVVGNTSIDVLMTINENKDFLRQKQKVVVTLHRRENQGKPLQEICQSLALLATEYPNLTIEILLHPNPSVRKTIQKDLSSFQNILLREPLDHVDFIHLLKESLFVITDSGGVQEEAPYLGKPVLVVRETTERMEGVEEGTTRLVGRNSEKIFRSCCELLENKELRARMSKRHSPYGQGNAANQIVEILEREFL